MGNGNILQRGKPIYGMTPCSLCKGCESMEMAWWGKVQYECSHWGTWHNGDIQGCGRFEADTSVLGDEGEG